MFVDFNRIFKPTREQKINKLETMLKVLKMMEYKAHVGSCIYSVFETDGFSDEWYFCKKKKQICEKKCSDYQYNNGIEQIEMELEELYKKGGD